MTVILEQKIRNPKADSSNKWIRPFYVTDDEQVHITDNAVSSSAIEKEAITNEKMYSGNEENLKPVSTDTIQSGSITARTMYGNNSEEVNNDLKPVRTGSIQDKAVTDSKIADKAISLKKIGEPLFILKKGSQPVGSTKNNFAIELYWNSGLIYNTASPWKN